MAAADIIAAIFVQVAAVSIAAAIFKCIQFFHHAAPIVAFRMANSFPPLLGEFLLLRSECLKQESAWNWRPFVRVAPSKPLSPASEPLVAQFREPVIPPRQSAPMRTVTASPSES